MTEDSQGGTESEIQTIPIRENLVDTAVNFLLNPNVKNKADHGKIAFLKNKGLTDPEISAAFDKAQQLDPSFPTSAKQRDLQQSFIPQPYYLKTYSFWSKLSSVSSSLIVIAVALYGLHRFYKLYIEPWIFGTKSEKDEMKDLVMQLSYSVQQLKNSVSILEETINSQKEQIDRVFLAEGSPYMPIPMAVAELKADIGNVKSLLINRHQFPAVPKIISSPSIPHWQIQGSETKDTDFETGNELTEKPFSPLPASLGKEQDGRDELQVILDGEPNKDALHFDPSNSLLITENGVNGGNPAVPKVISNPSIPLWQIEGSEIKVADSKADNELTEKLFSAVPASLGREQVGRDELQVILNGEPNKDALQFDPSDSLLTIKNGVNGVNPAVPKLISNPSIPLWQIQGSEIKFADSEADNELVEKPLSAVPASLGKEQDKSDELQVILNSEPNKDALQFDPSNSLLTIKNGVNGVNYMDSDNDTAKFNKEDPVSHEATE